MNDLLRSIFGIFRVNGVPSMGTQEMYKSFSILRLGSLYKLYLFKLLRALLDGRNPELFDVLLRPYYTSHNYVTRGGIFRHPHLTCEIERRYLSHQLIILYEQLPDNVLLNSLPRSVRLFKRSLLDAQ